MKKINLATLFADTAKLSELKNYQQQAIGLAGEGNEIILTGAAPVWLYLSIAHVLHGKAKKLSYQSPGLVDKKMNPTGVMIVFEHNAY